MGAPSSGAKIIVAFRSAKGCSFAERKTTFPKSDLRPDSETVGCPGSNAWGDPAQFLTTSLRVGLRASYRSWRLDAAFGLRA